MFLLEPNQAFGVKCGFFCKIVKIWPRQIKRKRTIIFRQNTCIISSNSFTFDIYYVLKALKIIDEYFPHVFIPKGKQKVTNMVIFLMRYVEWLKSIQYSQLRISTQKMTQNTRIPYHDTTIPRYTYLGNISCQRIGLDELTHWTAFSIRE